MLSRQEGILNGHRVDSEEIVDIGRLIHRVMKFLPGALLGILGGAILGWAVFLGSSKVYRSAVLVEFVGSPISRLLNPLDEFSSKEENGRSFGRYALAALSTPGAKMIARERLSSQGIVPDEIAFSVRSIASTNLLSFEARGRDPGSLQKAADLWTQSASQWLTKFQTEGALQNYDSLNRYYEGNKKVLSSIRDQIENLHPNLEIKKSLHRIKKDQLAIYDLELEQMKSAMGRAEAELPVLQEEIKKHEKIRPSVKSGSDENQESVPPVVVNSGQSQSLQGEWRTISYAVNPLFADLERRITENEISLKTMQSRRKNLEELSRATRSEIVSLGSEVGSLEIRIESLERDLQVARKEYDLLYDKLGESRFASSLNPSLLKVVSPASSAEVVSSRMVYVGFGALSGLLLGLSAGIMASVKRRNVQINKSFDMNQDRLRSSSPETISLG